MTPQHPADDDIDGLGGFAEAERAKRRLLFDLAELGLPMLRGRERAGGLAFDLLSSARETVSPAVQHKLAFIERCARAAPATGI